MRVQICMVALLAAFASGCDKKEERRTPAPPTGSVPDNPKADPPPPPQPPPKGPEKAEVLPTPGQAGDHSTPAFKGGGEPDKRK